MTDRTTVPWKLTHSATSFLNFLGSYLCFICPIVACMMYVPNPPNPAFLLNLTNVMTQSRLLAHPQRQPPHPFPLQILPRLNLPIHLRLQPARLHSMDHRNRSRNPRGRIRPITGLNRSRGCQDIQYGFLAIHHRGGVGVLHCLPDLASRDISRRIGCG